MHDDESGAGHDVLRTLGVGSTPSSGEIGVDEAFDTSSGIGLINDASLGVSE